MTQNEHDEALYNAIRRNDRRRSRLALWLLVAVIAVCLLAVLLAPPG